jgi:hypothetical protein
VIIEKVKAGSTDFVWHAVELFIDFVGCVCVVLFLLSLLCLHAFCFTPSADAHVCAACWFCWPHPSRFVLVVCSIFVRIVAILLENTDKKKKDKRDE